MFIKCFQMSFRSRITAAVQDITVSEVHQKKLLFVLHTDGSFRVWDLANRNKIFTHSFNVPSIAGKFTVSFWHEDAV